MIVDLYFHRLPVLDIAVINPALAQHDAQASARAVDDIGDVVAIRINLGHLFRRTSHLKRDVLIGVPVLVVPGQALNDKLCEFVLYLVRDLVRLLPFSDR